MNTFFSIQVLRAEVLVAEAILLVVELLSAVVLEEVLGILIQVLEAALLDVLGTVESWPAVIRVGLLHLRNAVERVAKAASLWPVSVVVVLLHSHVIAASEVVTVVVLVEVLLHLATAASSKAVSSAIV